MRRIDFVAPPFAGHLFPAIQLARGLSERGVAEVRVLSTAGAEAAAAAANLEHVELLPGRDADVWAIANTRRRVGVKPWQLWRQVQQNLALMGKLQTQLRAEWRRNRPDLVLADFVVPVAGLTAQQLHIPWWTGMPTPCALETPDGVPSYLGGWMPWNAMLGRLRDRAGRTAVHCFKRVSAKLFAQPLRDLGIESLYRGDGSEVIYSSDCILAYGLREFEFSRTWPPQLEFTGPLTESPFANDSDRLEIPDGSILISLGTHLPWAKDRAIKLFRQVAEQMPKLTFCFSRGMPGSTGREVIGNLQLHDFIPYSVHLDRFAAAVIHGGTGITYACLKAGLPMLVWPHDYDQFDHAARIVHHGLGKRLRPSAERVAEDLRWLMSRPNRMDESLRRFQRLLEEYDPIGAVTVRWNRAAEARSTGEA